MNFIWLKVLYGLSYVSTKFTDKLKKERNNYLICMCVCGLTKQNQANSTLPKQTQPYQTKLNPTKPNSASGISKLNQLQTHNLLQINLCNF